MDLVWSGVKTCFLSVETASTLLYAQETTTGHLQNHSCLPDRLVIRIKIEYFQTIRKTEGCFRLSKNKKKILN